MYIFLKKDDVSLISLLCYEKTHYLAEIVVFTNLQIVECLKVSNAHTNLFDFELCDNSQ